MKRALAYIVFFATVLWSCQENERSNSEYLEYATKIANWLKAQEVIKPEGKIWRSSDEQDSAPVFNAGLYNGSAGVVLFYLELYHQTESEDYLMEAMAGADYMLVALPDSLDQTSPPGLYVGVSGLGYTLGEVYRVTKDQKYLRGVEKVVKLLDEGKDITDPGHNWGSNTDIVSGNTGIGLFLLYAHDKLGIENSMELAVGVGNDLIAHSRDTIGGKKWLMDPSFPRYMPNFSHGTAGTAFFLASLYEYTNDEAHKLAALQGGNHLLSISNEGGLVYHHDPDTTGLIYYGWCHGPPGTNRLYTKLARLDANQKWDETIIKTNNTILKTNLLDREPNGFWNNLGQCCGSAGVADYFLSQYIVTKDENYYEQVQLMTNDIIEHLTEEGNGVKWVHAEHRSRPDLLQAQTGFAQGASGIGLYFLKLHAFSNNTNLLIHLPDSPF